MINNLKVLALIPARGGSKGIPRKNLEDVGGKPLIVHSIRHAVESKFCDRVVVSSDSNEINNIAKENGAEVLFKRPSNIAQSETLDLPVFQHMIDFLSTNEKWFPDIIIHLRPTAPYRREYLVDDGIKLLVNSKNVDSVRSVSAVDQHPYRMFTLRKDGLISPYVETEDKEPFLLRRQDLPQLYYYNCVLDVLWTKTILQKKSMTGNKIKPLIMNHDESYDIDTINDLDIIRSMILNKKIKL
jgi:CMP-N,N'-diacetyllegionaminic acid synthase